MALFFDAEGKNPPLDGDNRSDYPFTLMPS